MRKKIIRITKKMLGISNQAVLLLKFDVILHHWKWNYWNVTEMFSEKVSFLCSMWQVDLQNVHNELIFQLFHSAPSPNGFLKSTYRDFEFVKWISSMNNEIWWVRILVIYNFHIMKFNTKEFFTLFSFWLTW